MSNFDSITLEKGMYEAGNLTDVLERLDPSENYYDTELHGLDAFSRQLKRFDIKVSGNNSDTVEKFFATSNSAVLFPEYVRRCVQLGIDENNIVEDIVANTIDIVGFDYRSVYAEPDNNSLHISTYDSLVPIKRHRKLLKASYESLRFQRISTLTAILRQIGCNISRCRYRDDDNIYFEETKILSYPNPLCNRVVGLDNRYAVEMINCGGVKVDYEKLIDRNFENAEICSHTGFSIICPDAIATMEISYV